MSTMRMRRSLAQLEQEFGEVRRSERHQRERLQRSAAARARQRFRARQLRRSSHRFYVLALALITTVVLVTVAMFATLYLLLS